MTEKEQIKAWITEFLEGSDAFLVDIRLSPSKLAVFIDKPAGISLQECSALSRFLTQRLEEGSFLETHDLEVSSPGMDAPLMVPQQFLRRIGREMIIRDAEGKELKGILRDADESGIAFLETVTTKEKNKKIYTEVLHKMDYAEIREAKLVLTFKNKK